MMLALVLNIDSRILAALLIGFIVSYLLSYLLHRFDVLPRLLNWTAEWLWRRGKPISISILGIEFGIRARKRENGTTEKNEEKQ
jgi:hypothetical protein